jgi:hypothetical protein
MKAIKVMATVDSQGSLSLDQPLSMIENSRVEVIVLIPEAVELEEYEESNQEIISDFRQAWHEAMTGQTIPVSQLWDGIENV